MVASSTSAFVVPQPLRMPRVVSTDLAAVEVVSESVNAQIIALQAGTSLFASVFGFGDAIIAMPLLALLFDLDATKAAPLVTCVSTLMIFANLAVDYRSGKMTAVGRWRESGLLLAGAAAGVPVGVHTLVAVDPEVIRACVGLLLVSYGARELVVDDETAVEPVDRGDLLATLKILPFGFAAGFLGGAVAEPGPPAVVFGQTQRWDPATMRQVLFRFFLPVQMLTLFDLNNEGLLTTAVLVQAFAAVPAVALAVALGTALNRRIDPALFKSIVAALVLGLGLLCFSSAAPHLAEAIASPPPSPPSGAAIQAATTAVLVDSAAAVL
ncbi:hypothetical protein CTAYLR_000445 [Chrysophaeum taylorii]|uniref:Membrane transporter protein n=1 Tax=Chrysophaeum taylorii TaxID=2483200 RepID=A0AAD7UHG6_9STRA|nr:hypothetical protein CTAYLR_000445 [Chrysophaeum taylorii]